MEETKKVALYTARTREIRNMLSVYWLAISGMKRTATIHDAL